MTFNDTLHWILQGGVRVWVADGRLRYSATAPLDPGHLEALRTHKLALIEVLTPRRRWIVHLADGVHLVSYTPAVSMLEVAVRFPGAVDIEQEPEMPLPPPGWEPPRELVEWLDRIGETDPGTRGEWLTQAQDARECEDMLAMVRKALNQSTNEV